MGMDIVSNFSVKTDKLIDDRESFQTLALANDLPLNRRALGLTTFIIDENKYYCLKNDINTWEIDTEINDSSKSNSSTYSSDKIDSTYANKTEIPTKTSLGLDNVVNVDTTNPENINYVNGDIVNVKQALDIYQNTYLGTISTPTYIDNLDGTITINGDGIFNFSKIANSNGEFVRISVTSISTLTMIDQVVNYIYVDYNNGNPIYNSTTNNVVFLNNSIYVPVFRVTRYSIDLNILCYGNYGIGLANKNLYKDVVLHSFERQYGLILSTSVDRNPSVSSGTVWFGVVLNTLNENIAGTVGKFKEWYLNNNVWIVEDKTQYDNIYYSDGENRLTLSNNKYVAKYFFRSVSENNNCVNFVHGDEQPSIADALNEQIPNIPTCLSESSIYVGKIILEKDETTGIAYPRDWSDSVSNSYSTSHEELSDILQAGDGVLNGHISNVEQTIYGSKTFNSPIISSTSGLVASTDKNFVTDEEKTDILTISSKLETGNLIQGENITLTVDGNNVTINSTGGGSSITIDTSMSDTSENAVQNKVIKQYTDDTIRDNLYNSEQTTESHYERCLSTDDGALLVIDDSSTPIGDEIRVSDTGIVDITVGEYVKQVTETITTYTEKYRTVENSYTKIETDNLLSVKADLTDLPTKTSDLTNDSGFITNLVNNLQNYYLKSDTYTQSEVNSLLSAISTLDLQIVTTLPTVDISTSTIYLTLKDGYTDVYVQNVYINSAWATLGDTSLDLSGYALQTDIPVNISELTNDSGYALQTYVDGQLADKANTTDLHYHSNKEVLDLLGASSTNTLTYNGEEVGNGGGSVSLNFLDDTEYQQFSNGVENDLEFYDIGDLIDKSLGMIANIMGNYSCTATVASTTAYYAFDGKTNTAWTTGHAGGSLILSNIVDGILVYGFKITGDSIGSLVISGSDDGTTYETLKSYGIIDSNSTVSIMVDNEVNYKYYKFTTTSTNAYTYSSISECNIYTKEKIDDKILSLEQTYNQCKDVNNRFNDLDLRTVVGGYLDYGEYRLSQDQIIVSSTPTIILFDTAVISNGNVTVVDGIITPRIGVSYKFTSKVKCSENVNLYVKNNTTDEIISINSDNEIECVYKYDSSYTISIIATSVNGDTILNTSSQLIVDEVGRTYDSIQTDILFEGLRTTTGQLDFIGNISDYDDIVFTFAYTVTGIAGSTYIDKLFLADTISNMGVGRILASLYDTIYIAFNYISDTALTISSINKGAWTTLGLSRVTGKKYKTD